jgi:two-component system LytT family response regulator
VTLRVVVVDDEPVARRGLRHLLLEHEDVAIVGEARNGREAVQVVTALAPDLLFLDVQMPGWNGFEVLQRLDPPLPYVIFVTAHDDYAVEAFESHALDYLLKPVHHERFRISMQRARERVRSAAALEQALRLARLLEGAAPAAVAGADLAVERLVVPEPSGERIVDVRDVLWIEADGYYAAIHAHGRRHLLRESLDSLQRRLHAHRFVRTHRSAIVSLASIREFRREGGESAVILRDGTRVPVSRRRRALVASAIRRAAKGSS